MDEAWLCDQEIHFLIMWVLGSVSLSDNLGMHLLLKPQTNQSFVSVFDSLKLENDQVYAWGKICGWKRGVGGGGVGSLSWHYVIIVKAYKTQFVSSFLWKYVQFTGKLPCLKSGEVWHQERHLLVGKFILAQCQLHIWQRTNVS